MGRAILAMSSLWRRMREASEKGAREGTSSKRLGCTDCRRPSSPFAQMMGTPHSRFVTRSALPSTLTRRRRRSVLRFSSPPNSHCSPVQKERERCCIGNCVATNEAEIYWSGGQHVGGWLIADRNSITTSNPKGVGSSTLCHRCKPTLSERGNRVRCREPARRLFLGQVKRDPGS